MPLESGRVLPPLRRTDGCSWSPPTCTQPARNPHLRCVLSSGCTVACCDRLRARGTPLATHYSDLAAPGAAYQSPELPNCRAG